MWQFTCTMLWTCDCVRSIFLLSPMLGTSFLLVILARLIDSEPKHWVSWSNRTGINFPFFQGERNPILSCFCLTTSFLTHWCKLHLKNWKFLFTFKTFEGTKKFLSHRICSWMRNLEFIGVWWVTKETFLF